MEGEKRYRIHNDFQSSSGKRCPAVVVTHFPESLQNGRLLLRLAETVFGTSEMLFAKLYQSYVVLIWANFHETDEAVQELSNSSEILGSYASRAVDDEIYVVVSFLGTLYWLKEKNTRYQNSSK